MKGLLREEDSVVSRCDRHFNVRTSVSCVMVSSLRQTFFCSASITFLEGRDARRRVALQVGGSQSLEESEFPRVASERADGGEGGDRSDSKWQRNSQRGQLESRSF